MKFETRLLPSLRKVFWDEDPAPEINSVTGFINEIISFQWAFRLTDCGNNHPRLQLKIISALGADIAARNVQAVPVWMGTFANADDNYLRGAKPGLYPDLLTEIPKNTIHPISDVWQSVWFDIAPDNRYPAGDYGITLQLCDAADGSVLCGRELSVHLIGANLPKQALINTRWLHADCLSEYYHVPVFSEEWWNITENYVRCAAKRGINMLLTPIHTPPLDTRIGSERLTVQLVTIRLDGGRYSFSFENLERWVRMCQNAGIAYFEMAHLFTQWGAMAAPKIMAWTEGAEKRIFGWDTPAAGEEYRAFLSAYLPALCEEIERLHIEDRVFFHISDEPSAEGIAGYTAAKEIAEPYLKDFPIIDALSDIQFYQSGAVRKPIPACNHIEPFLEAGVPDLWTYYCCGQYKDVPNLFIAMPSARTRILGVLLYKFNIEGFLQWAFNFWNSQYSDYPINPFLQTDCDGFVPAGDGWQVYPGPDGRPLESIRLMLFAMALYDLRALKLLESLAGRDFVMDLIDGGQEKPLRFDCYPRGDCYIETLRNRISAEIEKRL